jgi:hypothetical protein
VDEAYKWKHLRYAELAAEAQQRGWNTDVRPVEVGCRGLWQDLQPDSLQTWELEAKGSVEPSRLHRRQP